jgi:protein TIF31
LSHDSFAEINRSVNHRLLFTLGTVVLDYRGYRVTAQSIIPGILEREQEQSVVYGSIDFGKTVVTQTKYLDLLQKAGNQLKILPHKVVNDKGEEIELCSSVECKGIIGNDGRHYILDLLRTFPPDVNFLKVPEMTLSKEAQALGFPIEHRHKLSCLGQELIDAFVESRYMMFIKCAAVQLQQLTVKKQRRKERGERRQREREGRRREEDNGRG